MWRRVFLSMMVSVFSVFLSLPVVADATGRWANGEEVYNKVCGYCHEVGVGPYLLGRQFPAAVIEYMARNGSRAMPAMKPSFIDDTALKSVAEFIEKSKAGPNAPQSSVNLSPAEHNRLVSAREEIAATNSITLHEE